MLQRSAMSSVRDSTSGESLNTRSHFVVALDEEIGAMELHAVGVLDRLAGLNAEHHVLRVSIVFAEIVAVVGGHQRQAQIFFQLETDRDGCGVPCSSPWS